MEIFTVARTAEGIYFTERRRFWNARVHHRVRVLLELRPEAPGKEEGFCAKRGIESKK